MDLYEAVETICKNYCKYPDLESGNKLADICDKCPMNKCEELRWADLKTEPNCSEIPNNCETCANGEGDIEACGYCRHGDLYEPKDEPFDKDINVRSKDDPQTERNE